MPDAVNAVHAGQVDIHQHYVNLLRWEICKGRFGVGINMNAFKTLRSVDHDAQRIADIIHVFYNCNPYYLFIHDETKIMQKMLVTIPRSGDSIISYRHRQGDFRPAMVFNPDIPPHSFNAAHDIFQPVSETVQFSFRDAFPVIINTY